MLVRPPAHQVVVHEEGCVRVADEVPLRGEAPKTVKLLRVAPNVVGTEAGGVILDVLHRSLPVPGEKVGAIRALGNRLFGHLVVGARSYRSASLYKVK